MAQLAGPDEIESFRIELAEIGRSIRTIIQEPRVNVSTVKSEHGRDADDEDVLQWVGVERLPTFERITTALFEEQDCTAGNGDVKGKRIINVAKLGAQERHMFIEKLIKHIENDNLRLLHKLRKRIDKVGVQLPTVEVRYKNLCVEAECEIVQGKPLPTLWNTTKSIFSGIAHLSYLKQRTKISIIKDVSGVIKPGRMTLLLGPPGCGKTTMLLALSGKLSHSLKVAGEMSYNGHKLEEFVPQKSSAYVSQYDLHIPEMTVRETIDFSARCQGTGSRAEIMMEVSRREKQAGILPDSDVDAYMKAISVEGLKSNLQTDYILKILGLDICADTMAGDAMRRGISGGQKKRLTTGEMIVGPTRALFMDEISNGLDSSTTFQIVSCLKHLSHIMDATVMISLLQPAPETFDLFDDIILMTEGKIVYHGPRSSICQFFEDCGFRCPERKGVADFLQEVISRKDQGQYWFLTEKPYSYVSVDQFGKKFKESQVGKNLEEEISKPFDKSKNQKGALSLTKYSLTKWELFKACSVREFLLMKRNSFIYVFKTTQLLIIASITMTVLLRTRMAVDAIHASYYMGALFYGLIILLVDGFPETQMTFFINTGSYVFILLGLMRSLLLSSKFQFHSWKLLFGQLLLTTSSATAPEFGRFLRHFLLLFLIHLTSTSMFRFVASVFQTAVASTAVGSLTIVIASVFGGFVISGNTSIGQQTLESRGLNFHGYFYWISVGALIGMTVLLNIGFTMALTFLKPPGNSRAIISREKYNQLQGKTNDNGFFDQDKILTEAPAKSSTEPKKGSSDKEISPHLAGRMVLPFEPLTMTFTDVQYYVDTPPEMRKHGNQQKKLRLLSDITGAFKPGILTALMGVSGAGKTTLMDVLSGRKTGGTIEGEIRIGGYLKVQDSFARISGYCEQSDIHSPQITVEESLVYSAWLRLPPEIDAKTRISLKLSSFDGIKDSLVGMPGDSGLSTEQRKRLTIAVELVSNPSIIFMDEPTSGLDARAAAIVMRAAKNIVETGRTVVCTIHQPSIDIFEAFDELILMKIGGRIIYSGPLGQRSSRVIEYFELLLQSAEAALGVDFGQIYEGSTLYHENEELVKQLSSPTPGSKELHFPTRFPQNGWEQLKACLWKQNLSYWRSPSYNLVRIIFMACGALLFSLLYWQKGKENFLAVLLWRGIFMIIYFSFCRKNEQDLFNIAGSMYAFIVFFGINNCSSVLPFVATERTVLYRERFAGMYSSWAYSFAQVLVEIPYLFVQSVIYVIIAYPMIGYSLSAGKIFWSFYSMFCTLLFFNYQGMLLVSLTPNIQVAAILASFSYTMLNFFSGFVVPKPHIPKWWLWLYYICPTSWALNGMLTSQYGDVDEEISVFGDTRALSAFVEDYFGYHHSFLSVVGVVLIIFPIVTASLFAYFIGRLNFQRSRVL
uniref:ABC transporter domain-containing protein n=1 Tax=Salix viminalis TaxID=40686 RepID=A0A6N2LL61_SALVM